MGGPLGLSHIEIAAYSQLMDDKLSRWEIAVIKRMDSAFLDEVGKLGGR